MEHSAQAAPVRDVQPRRSSGALAVKGSTPDHVSIKTLKDDGVGFWRLFVKKS